MYKEVRTGLVSFVLLDICLQNMKHQTSLEVNGCQLSELSKITLKNARSVTHSVVCKRDSRPCYTHEAARIQLSVDNTDGLTLFRI